WGSGEKNFVREIFDFCVNNTEKNFFNDYLEPFFYEALNTKRKNNYFKRFNCKIPFLNGGLFEPLEGYHWKDVEFSIPNELFSNVEEKGREADGILDIFDRFNFTINEDEPLEKEVAVDPEMLGKIFENLLDVSDRKSKGAYYTPREIVHYMCQESLINYLVNEAGVPYEDMKEFILYGEIIRDADNRKDVGYGKEFTIRQTIYDNIVAIDNALENVRIADPAVGSGAFPLGILNEIVKARNNITEYIIRKDKEGYFGERYGEEFIRKWRDPYKYKRKTIKNSIFAVDIEPSAVDIAKLRLWLSVVVEQEINEDNPEPHTLPNLDMNIKVGNSLIDEYEGIKLFDKNILNREAGQSKSNGNAPISKVEQLSLLIDYTDEILQNMFDLQDRYFEEEDEDKKREIKTEIDEIRHELIRYKLRQDNNIEGLARYEESIKEKTRPYFIWEMEFARVFKEKGGFDIVIGNPPYIDSEMMVRVNPELRELLSSMYESAKGNWDLFVIFIEKGVNLLKGNGCISFVVPNKLISAKYTEALRTLLLRWNFKEIRDYSNIKVFAEADVYPIVFLVEKNPVKNDIKMTVMEDISQYKFMNRISPEAFYTDIYWDKYFLNELGGVRLIQKLGQFTKLEHCATVLGAATVNEAYKFKEVVLEQDQLVSGIGFKRFINSGTIDPYLSLWNNKKMTYIKGTYTKPVLYDKDIKDISITRFNQAQSEKIIIAGMTKQLECYYDNGNYLAAKSTVIILKQNVDLKYLVALLNSKLITYFFNSYFSSLSLSGGYLRVGPPQIKQIPISLGSTTEQKEIVDKVEVIIDLADKNDCNIDLEKQVIAEKTKNEIDQLVYRIYNLTPEEIQLVEDFYKR
ncbi:MAG TPA: TaqI-like C-terminal specificity domain-containing protein, partial [Syntrophomonadaceae bacterium]|nr:TaqI-like C-terminal specificity domain-containing protein [Syntrophomonadaceae bacterium]